MSDERRGAIDALLAKSKRTLEAARSVLESGFFDDASSRAYYAAFHAICAALASREMYFSSHGRVLGTFNREFVKAGQSPAEAFQKIRRLFEHRQVGDYSVTLFIDKATAEQDLDDATWILEECRRIIEDGPCDDDDNERS